jgi:preprotein translocase subunit SecD
VLAVLACSTSTEKSKAVDWGHVPVAIELRLAHGKPGAGLVRATVYGQSATVYLDSATVVSNSDVARVEAMKTRIGTGLILQVWLTKTGAKRIADITAHHIGDSLAVLVNSVVVSVPVIHQALNPGTRYPSDIGVPLRPEESERLARAVAKTWPRRR